MARCDRGVCVPGVKTERDTGRTICGGKEAERKSGRARGVRTAGGRLREEGEEKGAGDPGSEAHRFCGDCGCDRPRGGSAFL